MAHKNPLQTVRLIHRLSAPNTTFFIHIDKKSEDVYRVLKQELVDAEKYQFVRRFSIAWGDVSFTDARIECLRTLCRSGGQFDFVAMLSGQDYPLADNQTIEQTLEKYRGQELLRISPLPIRGWGNDGGFSRFTHYHFRVGNRHFTYPPRTTHGWKGIVGSVLTKFVGPRRSLPFEYKPYGGSDWWCITGKLVAYLCELHNRPEWKTLRKRIRHTNIVSEVLLQTIVGNSPFREKVADYYPWFIDWSEKKPNPAILTVDRFDELAGSGKLFARKFDVTVDSAILDRIDYELLGVR
jgi:hypothetical protein